MRKRPLALVLCVFGLVLGCSSGSGGAGSATDVATTDSNGGEDTEQSAPEDGRIGDTPETADTSSPPEPDPSTCESQPVADPVDTLEGTLTDGSAFLYTQNLEAKGLIVAFHGGGGSKEDLLHRRVDAVLIAREAMHRGYSLAALDSVQHLEDNPPNTKWSTVMNIDPTAGEVNPDIVNALEMIDRLRDPQDLAAVSKAAPLIVFGYSNGGTMASRVAQFAPVAVSVTYISNSSAYLEEGAVRPPMVLVPGQNDLDHYATESNTELAAEIEAAGGEVLLIVNPPEAITPGLFQRVPGISCEASRALGQTLADAGWLDSNWMLTANPKSDSSWRDLLSADLAAYKVPISDVLYEARAEHTPSSDWNESVFDFVDANL